MIQRNIILFFSIIAVIFLLGCTEKFFACNTDADCPSGFFCKQDVVCTQSEPQKCANVSYCEYKTVQQDPICGNNVCEALENVSCPSDCGQGVFCGKCGNECSTKNPQQVDCPVSTENFDCKPLNGGCIKIPLTRAGQSFCGDGVCGHDCPACTYYPQPCDAPCAAETTENCPQDCSQTCIPCADNCILVPANQKIDCEAPAQGFTCKLVEGQCKKIPTNDCGTCTYEYNPVCGTNGKTYSNECIAKCVGTSIDYRGECNASALSECVSNYILTSKILRFYENGKEISTDSSVSLTVEQKLSRIYAYCSNGKLYRGVEREIKIFEMPCWGEPWQTEEERIQREQETKRAEEELEKLRSEFKDVIVPEITCA